MNPDIFSDDELEAVLEAIDELIEENEEKYDEKKLSELKAFYIFVERELQNRKIEQLESDEE